VEKIICIPKVMGLASDSPMEREQKPNTSTGIAEEENAEKERISRDGKSKSIKYLTRESNLTANALFQPTEFCHER
jgi:hypothetical protein